MICLECANLDLKANPVFAARGLGRCKYKNLPGLYVSVAFHRTCEQFTPADSKKAQANHADWEGED